MFDIASYGALLIFIIVILLQAVKVMREYERAVVFTLGRFSGVKGPGLILLIPVVQQMVKVDLRTIVLDVPSQDLISRDNVSVKVSAVIYFRVIDADRGYTVALLHGGLDGARRGLADLKDVGLQDVMRGVRVLQHLITLGPQRSDDFIVDREFRLVGGVADLDEDGFLVRAYRVEKHRIRHLGLHVQIALADGDLGGCTSGQQGGRKGDHDHSLVHCSLPSGLRPRPCASSTSWPVVRAVGERRSVALKMTKT